MARAQDRREIPTSIMVSGNNEDRHRERGKAIADDLVLLRQAAIGQVAGHHDAVGLGHERGKGLDRPPQGSFCVDNTIGEPPTWPQMRIGDLGKDHGRAERGRPRSASCYFMRAVVSATSLSRPSCGLVVPRIAALMISRCVRQMRTELPPG